MQTFLLVALLVVAPILIGIWFAGRMIESWKDSPDWVLVVNIGLYLVSLTTWIMFLTRLLWLVVDKLV